MFTFGHHPVEAGHQNFLFKSDEMTIKKYKQEINA